MRSLGPHRLRWQNNARLEKKRGAKQTAKTRRGERTRKAKDVNPALFRGALGLKVDGRQSKKAFDLHKAPIEAKSLPTMADALADPSFASLEPKATKVPQSILRALEQSQNVLVIGHIRPDGDTLGSVLSLTRLLDSMGKDATACIDDPRIPGELRGLDPDDQVKTWDQVDKKAFDLVVIADVAALDRIGGAEAAVRRAPNVMILDHHNTDATPEDLKMAPGAKLHKHIDRDADATAYLIASIGDQLAGDKFDASMTAPLLVSMVTDTGSFGHPNTNEESLRIFKHLVETRHNGEVSTVDECLGYSLPEAAKAILHGEANPGIKDKKLAAKYEELKGLGLQLKVNAPKGEPYATVVCPKEVFDLALEVARLDDPKANEHDLRNILMDQIDDLGYRQKRLAALIVESADGVGISTRSPQQGPAQRLAERFGGGGHPHKAAARPKGSLAEVKGSVDRFMTLWAHKRKAGLFMKGSAT